MPDETENSIALSNPKRAPAGAIGNGVNMGWFALAMVWLNAQVAAWIPITIDPASGLPTEGSVELQQAAALLVTGVAAAIAGFVSNVIKNVRASQPEGEFAATLAKVIVARLP